VERKVVSEGDVLTYFKKGDVGDRVQERTIHEFGVLDDQEVEKSP